MVRSLASLVGELEVERVTPARLRGALGRGPPPTPRTPSTHARWGGSSRGTASRSIGCDRPYPERRATRALDSLRRAPALWGSTPVLLYGFDDFTRLQLDTIETLGASWGPR